MKTIEHFIGGKEYSGNSKRFSPVYNPATGEQSAKVKLGSAQDLNKAVKIAHTAFLSWSNKTTITKSKSLI